jgi:hypothetical protein
MKALSRGQFFGVDNGLVYTAAMILTFHEGALAKRKGPKTR